ncbi:Fur family transcriptional regulator [Canibacter zhoujuaniae]|uniref:Fur family transcriptional regulator n=1 Tax=Canibacter zhoujuaniae TaxID=2708343 RepID=UPI00141F7D8A|nr:transcriptional repressor [Canibacter zhoujuaniae]
MVVKRNTWQREAVRAAMAAETGFVSAQQLHDRLRAEGSTIGLATVYRSLATLVELGEADMLNSPEGENLFRFCSTDHHHHHLICRKCGAAVEIAAAPVERWAQEEAKRHGYSDVKHVIDIFGICAKCR